MNANRAPWFAILIALIAVGVLALLSLRPTSNSALEKSTNANPPSAPPAISRDANRGLPAMLGSATTDLSGSKSPDEKAQVLMRLRAALAGVSGSESARTITEFLDTKADARTGEGFQPGGGGNLAEAPTLRTWLLDQLAQLDPAAAAAYARVILNESASPDEWALALRNLARGDPSAEARRLLDTKTGELLRNESWQQNPTAGYLEAFDTAVYLGGTNLLPTLGDLVRKKDNQAVAHAAFLSLDRLAIKQPIETLTTLAQHPDWMQGREETRANYFARANVGDPAQRTIVEAYLLDPRRSPNELHAFAGVFPNANFMISHNLLTENVTLEGGTLARRDQAALAAVNQWLADPRFARVKPALEKMQVRLLEFTRPAAR